MTWPITKLRERFGGIHVRLDKLEKEASELGLLLDVVIADEAFNEAPESGLNSQTARKRLIADVFEVCGFQKVVETGTYMGMTTAYLAHQFSLPISSCEISTRYFGVAKKLLRNCRNISLENCDSRTFLRKLSGKQDVSLTTFFYLDAHWYEDLPLRDEIEIIAGNWTDFLIMVDDFQVPGDSGYGFDCYGPQRALTIGYIADVLGRFDLRIFYPSEHSDNECGKRRGCALIAPEMLACRIESLEALRQAGD